MNRAAGVVVGVLLVLAGVGAEASTIAVEGRVVGPDERPLAEAEVVLFAAPDPILRANLTLAGMTPEAASRSKTDVEGRFRVEAPHAGHWVVRVDLAGYVPVEMRLPGLLEPADLDDAKLIADAGLTVRLVTPAGEPLPDGLVELGIEGERIYRGGMRQWNPASRSGFSGPDGAVRFARGEGEPTIVTASAPGRSLADRRVISGTALTMELSAAVMQTLEVRSADDRPAPEILVRLGDQAHPIGFTDEAGRIEVPGPTKGELAARLDAADGGALSSRLAPAAGTDEPRVLRLPERRSISGRLIDATTRRAIAGGLVWDQTRVWAGAVTDGSGGFTLHAPLNHGTYVAARAPGYLELDRPVQITFDDSGRRGPVLALEPGSAVEGVVVDADGEPVADAQIGLEVKHTGGMMRIEIDFGGGRAPATKTSSRGKFRLSPVDPEKDYEMKIHAEGFGPASKEIKGLRPYETKSGLRIELRRGQIATGRVVDGDGIALADARVTLTASPLAEVGGMRMMRWGGEGGPETPSFEGTTDIEGRFEIAGLAPGLVDVEIRRSGYAKREAQGLEIAEGEQPSDLGEFDLEPGERLQGRVVDPDGAVIEGAEVTIPESTGGHMMMIGPGPSNDEPDAVTGPDGWFTVEDLAAGETVDVRVERRGFVGNTRKAVQVPTSEILEIELEPASRVSGIVQDEEEVGIPGAEVNLRRSVRMEMGGRVAMAMTMMQERADGEGRFVFEEIQPGEISLSAKAAGWQEAKLDAVEVPKGEDVEEIRLTLDPGAYVEGRVMAPDGRPAVGATVGKVAESSGMGIRGLDGAFTDGDGYYRLEGLTPGPVSVEATHDDYPRVVRDLEVETGINRLDLQFEGGQEVSGTVLDESGNPVASAWVSLAPTGRGWGGPNGKSDADGTFAIAGVRDGDYEVSAGAEGYVASEDGQKLTVAGQPVPGVQVVLGRGGTIRGKVRGAGPEDYPRVAIEAERQDGRGFGQAAVDHEGEFVMRDVTPGQWRLTATLGDTGRQATGKVEVVAAQDEAWVDLEFGLGLVLSGTVHQGDEPVVGVSVFAAGTDVERSGWANTDSEGAFRVEGLESGTYRVEVRNWSTGLAHDETFEVTSSREVKIRIPTSRVSGEVIDSATRDPIAGVTVIMEPASEPERRGVFPSHGGTTDMEGKFNIDNLGEGIWRLAASKSGYAATTQNVQVQRTRDRAGVKILMDPTEGLTLEVKLPSGGAPDDVNLAVLDPAGGTLLSGRYATGENGSVRLTSVPPGSWDVLASAGGSATSSFTATAPGGSNRVELSPATALDVVVPDLTGTGAVATVTLTGADGRPYRTVAWFGSTNSEWRMTDGKVEFRTLPPGSWTVRVSSSDSMWEGTATTSIGAPATLTLE